MSLSALDPLAATWWSWIVPLSLQALLLAGLALAFERLLGRRVRPGVLALLWGLLLLRLVLPPAAGEPLARAPLAPALEQPAAVVQAARIAPAGGALPRAAFALWLAGGGAVAGLALGRAHALRRRLRGPRDRAQEARLAPLFADEHAGLGLRRRVALEVRRGAPGPLVMGLLRPRVVVPDAFAAREELASLEAALLHELAHVARRDPWRDALLLAAQLPFWFHPAAWLAGRRLRSLAEAGADARAARALAGGAVRYRQLLAGIARRALEARPAGGRAVLALAGHRHELSARLTWLTPGRRRRHLHRAAEALALVLFAFACLPLTAPPEAWRARLTEVLGQSPPEPSSLEGCLQRRHLLFALAGGSAGGADSRDHEPSNDSPPQGHPR